MQQGSGHLARRRCGRLLAIPEDGWAALGASSVSLDLTSDDDDDNDDK